MYKRQRPEHTGDILLEGKKMEIHSISEQIERGFALVPEDRQREGLVQTMSILKNISLSSIKKYVKGFLLDDKLEGRRADEQIKDIHIKAVSYTHLSAQDIAAFASVPNMRVYLPSDRFQTRHLMEALLEDEKPAYIRVGRNPVEDVYEEGNVPFVMDKATVITQGTDAVSYTHLYPLFPYLD